MIKFGNLKLKKNNFFLLFFLIFLIFSCKTIPSVNKRKIEPLELLDNKSSFYFSIPANVDKELLNNVIKNNIQNINEKDLFSISNRVEKIYLGLNSTKKTTEIQSVIEGKIPLAIIPSVFNQKNGWNKKALSFEQSKKSYNIYNNEHLQLSFPNENFVCLGRDVDFMIQKYDLLSTEEIDLNNSSKNSPKIEIKPEIYEYLRNNENEIRFYSNRPQSFLSSLMGTNLDLRLENVKGSFVVDNKNQNQYLVNLHFLFKSPKFMKASKVLLEISFGLTDSQSIVLNENELQINGILIKKTQLYKLLGKF